MTDKCYSSDNENFNHKTLGDLIDSTMGVKAGDSYYEADCGPVELKDAISVENILEDMDQRVGDELGEVYDNECSDVTDEAKVELHALLEGWLSKHVSLSRYWKIVGKTRECKYTAEDLAR